MMLPDNELQDLRDALEAGRGVFVNMTWLSKTRRLWLIPSAAIENADSASLLIAFEGYGSENYTAGSHLTAFRLLSMGFPALIASQVIALLGALFPQQMWLTMSPNQTGQKALPTTERNNNHECPSTTSPRRKRTSNSNSSSSSSRSKPIPQARASSHRRSRGGKEEKRVA